VEPVTDRGATTSLTLDPAAAKPTTVGVLRVFLDRVLRDPVRQGRLRNVDRRWPVGLGAIVATAYLAYGVGMAIVIFSSPIRETAELSISSSSSASMPRSYVWLLLVLVVLALALFQTSAMHASWWLRVVGLIASVVVTATWSLRGTSLAGGLVETVVSALLMIALVVFTLVRGRRPFAWWEFPVVLLLLGTPVVLGVELMNRTSRPLGFDFVPVYLGSTMTMLAPAALPAAVAAGLSVAEITVSATLWATRLTAGHVARRVAYLILVLLLVIRVGQATTSIATWDFVRQGGNVFLTWVIFAGLLAGLSVLMLRLAGVREHLAVSRLPERMAGMSLALGLGLVGLSFIAVVVLGVFSVLAALAPSQMAAQSGAWLNSLSSVTGPNVFRILFALALIGLAIRFARRGQAGTALLLTAVGVMLLARVIRWATSGVLDAGRGFDALNLVATAVLLVAISATAVRRRLTPERAVGFSGALVLTALLGYHDFVSDPVGAVLGFSGAGLVLFGLTWGLFTDSGYANSGSRKYPVPTRVLFVLANAMVAISILAYSSLVRDPTATVNLEDFAVVGDEVLGTALLAATFVSVLTAVRGQRPIE
jgi:hypothetical protein